VTALFIGGPRAVTAYGPQMGRRSQRATPLLVCVWASSVSGRVGEREQGSTSRATRYPSSEDIAPPIGLRQVPDVRWRLSPIVLSDLCHNSHTDLSERHRRPVAGPPADYAPRRCYGWRDFSPGTRAISAMRAPFGPSQEFLVSGYLSVYEFGSCAATQLA
jgi:hypothetical protein